MRNYMKKIWKYEIKQCKFKILKKDKIMDDLHTSSDFN